MKKKNILIYSILISMVFSFAVIYFALALTIEYKQGNYRTDRMFYRLCEEVENSANGLPSMALVEENGNFAAVTIFKNRKCIFSYPSENVQDIENTKLIKISKKTIKNGNSTLEVNAAIYTLRPLSIFHYGKISFIVILIATLFTIGLIIYNSIKDDNETEETDDENSQEESLCDTNTEANSNKEETEPENSSNDEKSDDEGKDENEEEESDNSKENAENSSEDIKTNDELKESEENNTINAEQNECDEAEQNADSNSGEEYESDEQNTDINEDARTTEDSKEQDEQEITEAQSSQSDTTTTEEESESDQNETSTITPNMDSSDSSTNEAQEIFSVSTGFCLQNQLQTRLDAELVRCGASELDLSLFIVKITNSEISEEIAKKIGDCLLYKIQFRDCIFEYGKNSFAFIIPEIEIEQAEDFAEELYNDISKIIDNTDAECFIGISARTMRVISASRLINEAEEALDHATKDGKSKIIGFHVDIEKYRQFIKEETK